MSGIGPNTPGKSNPAAGEALAEGIVLSLDEEAGVIRFKMWGQLIDLGPARAKRLAAILDDPSLAGEPVAYDMKGNEIGSAVKKLTEFANAIEDQGDS